MKSFLILMMLLLSVYCFGQDDKGAKKNQKIVDREEQQFQRALSREPDTAKTYFDHANKLVEIKSECGRAGDFYQMALKYDTANAGIYKNYGKYLFDIQRSYAEAKTALQKALKLSADDAEIKKYLLVVNNDLALQEEDIRQRSFGTTSVRELNPGGNFTAMIKFDSLIILTTVPGNKCYYQNLLDRYLANDKTLSPDEMYMMIVGYSKQKTYNPFNYNDITEMKMMASGNLDSAIKKGNQLMLTNPLNPSLNREMMYYYRRKNEPGKADVYLNHIHQFFNGVLYSGNGSCDRPYISLWAKEEYNFITYLGYKATENHTMGTCAGQMAETINVKNPVTQKEELINFNVGLIYMQAVGK